MYSRFALIMIFMAAMTSHSYGDSCSDILMNGVMETFNVKSSDNLHESVVKSVCTKSDSQRDGSSSFEFNIPIPKLGKLGIGAGSGSESKNRSEFCEEFDQNVDHQKLVDFAKSVASEKIVSAWESCMGSKGLSCDAKNLGEKIFKIEVSWRPSVVAPDPVISNDLVVVGGTCENNSSLRKGEVIKDKVSVYEVCSRETDDTIVAYLNTTQGGLECLVPRIVKEEPLKPEQFLDACAEGLYEGCFGLQQEMRHKFYDCRDSLGPKPSSSDPAALQNWAMTNRKCGNLQASGTGIMALVENVWDACGQTGPGDNACKAAKQNLLRAKMFADTL